MSLLLPHPGGHPTPKPQTSRGFLPISLITILAGCTVTPTGNGGYRLSTGSIGSLIGDAPAAQGQTSAPPGQAAKLSFAGAMDGGPGTADLTPAPDGTYSVHLNVESSNGYGNVVGTVIRNGNVLTMSEGSDGPGPPSECRVTMTLQGNQLSVWEHSCSAFHGMSVSFDGTLTATNQ